MLQAHHINPEAPAGDIPFTEPSLEDLVEMVKEGKLEKDVLGDRADEFSIRHTKSKRKTIRRNRIFRNPCCTI